jgi:DNA-binding response OmpR family regulator
VNLILVVDDERDDCERMADALTREGYGIQMAMDAPSAMRIIEQQPNIDLLITDISLPGTNGCELARQTLELRPSIRVLFVSGYVGAEVCHYYGVPITDMFFLRKPFTPQGLLARVRRVLESAERVQLTAPPATGAGGSAS